MYKWCMKIHLTDRAGTVISTGGLDEETLAKALSGEERSIPVVITRGPDTIRVIPRASILYTDFSKEGF